MRWVLMMMVVAGAAWADEKPANVVDVETLRAAQEKLNARAATQPSEVEKLRKENRELKEQLSLVRGLYEDRKAELSQLRAALGLDKNGKKEPSKFRIAKGMSYEQIVAVKGKPQQATMESGEIASAIWEWSDWSSEVKPPPISGGGTAAVVTNPLRERIGDPLGINPTSRRMLRVSFVKGMVDGWTEDVVAR